MQARSLVQSFVVVIGMLSGLSGCLGLEPSDLENETEQFVLPAPTGVTATAVSDTKITVSWTAVPGAFKYFVVQSVAGGPFNNIATVFAPLASRTIINLTPNTLYAYQVYTAAPDGSISGPSAPPATATTFAVAPGAPTNVAATAPTSSQIDLTWTSSPTAVKYYIFQSQAGGAFTYVATVLAPGTSRTFTGLVAGTQYCYRIQSGLGDGSFSGASTPDACATTGAGPVPPAVVSASPSTDTRIIVQWQAAANASRYFIYQSESGGPFAFKGSTLASQQAFLATNLTASTSYCYRVTTVFANNAESAQSGSACATTFAPGGVGFAGYWKFDERTGATAIDSSGFVRNGTIANATYGLTPLTDKPQIDDNVSAIMFTSAPASAVTVPNATAFDLLDVFTVAFWAKLPAAADVTFIGMRGPGCGSPGWEIGQDAANGLHFSGQTQLVPAGTTIPVGVWTHVAVTYQDGTLRIYVNGIQTAISAFTPDNTQTTALNMGHVAGCAGGAVLMDEVQISARTLSAGEVAAVGALPPAPLNLRVTSKTSASIGLAWDPVPGATAYILSKGTAPGNETFYTHTPNATSYGVDHLAQSTQYSFTIRAVVGRLFSDPSTSAFDTTFPPPAAPLNVSAMVTAPDRIVVSWDAVDRAAKYYVFRSTGGAFTFLGTVLSPGLAFENVNLSPATTYSYEVEAEDVALTIGPLSLPASATTP